MKVEVAKSWETAISAYGNKLKGVVAAYPDADLLELGAGRFPGFRLNEMPSNVRSYTVNDISMEELSLLPEGYQKACFDVCGDATSFEGRYDVVFSRFLLEHVPNGKALHRNVYNVLKPGGAAFHLIPTLYATPFLINKLFPERLTAIILRKLAPSRSISPKFPAYYSDCRGNTPGMRKMLHDIGYSYVEITNFYGHFYYDKIPVMKEIQESVAAIASKGNWSWISSYAHIEVRK